MHVFFLLLTHLETVQNTWWSPDKNSYCNAPTLQVLCSTGRFIAQSATGVHDKCGLETSSVIKLKTEHKIV